ESPRNLLVPLDGSEAAESVLRIIPRLLGTIGTGKVTLTSVVQPPFPISSAYLPHAVSEEALHEQQLQRVRDYLDEVAGRLEAAGVATIDIRVVDARDPAQGILQLCEEQEDIDMIGISSHGRGGVARFFLGSVADKLLRAAPVPVLVTRRPEQEEGQ
ncbi:MAG: universal stress protein, partial [Gemmatimonadota bacterium]